MRKGFMYLTAIIDVHRRYIVSWQHNNKLDASNCIEVQERTISKYDASEIINSGQRMSFTLKERTADCAVYPEMKVGMDGKGMAKDNISIERFWKTFKNKYIYIRPEDTGLELYHGINKFVDDYNHHRRHQGINHMVPGKIYLKKVA